MAQSKEQTRIMLADDHKIVRDGLRAVLEKTTDMAVVGGVADGRSAVDQAYKLVPDVVVMDISMPDLNGVDATRQIIKNVPHIKIICLSVHRKKQFVTAMLEAGASAYLLKRSAGEELIEAVRTVARGEVYLSPPIATDIVGQTVAGKATKSKNAFTVLSKREREILQLIAEGLPASEIANQLSLSSKTVFAHRQRLMEKLGLESTVAIVKYALREGLIEL